MMRILGAAVAAAAMVLVSLAGASPAAAGTAPLSVNAVAGSAGGEASVSWSAPSDATDLLKYQVVPRISGVEQAGLAIDVSAASTGPVTVSGLTNGQSYTFVVKAWYLAGPQTSDPSGTVVPFTVPGAPTISSAVRAAAGQVTVSWAAPATDGGSAVTGYTVSCSPSCTQVNTVDLSATVTNLTPTTAYTFTVVATNARGSSVPSSASASVTPYGVPGVPTGVSGVAGDAQVTVSWSAPASDGGSTITLYTVTSSPGSKTCTDSGTLSCTVTGLTNNTDYTFTVRATNAAGAGDASVASSIVTPTASGGATTPGVPRNLAGTAGVGQVALTWDAPTSDGGSAITSYQVEYKLSSAGSYTTWSPNPTGTSVTVTGLTQGSTYDFRVAATNSVGTGSNTSPISRTPVAGLSLAYAAIQAQVGTPVSESPVVSGGSGTKTYAAVDTLPAGLTINSSTGVISGTPSGTAAVAAYTVSVTDSSGSTTAEVSVTVQAALAFTAGFTAVQGQVGSAVSTQTPSVSNGYGTKSYGISPSLPTGMTFSASTGAIGGTPSVTQAATTHTVTVTDGQGFTATTTVSVTVKATLSFTTGYTAVLAQQGTALTSSTPVVANGYGTLAYSSLNLPAGLTVNSSTGVISGTPTGTQAATNATITVTDAQSFTATATVSITIQAALSITGYSAISGQVGSAVSTQTPSASNGYGTKTYGISPSLPTGMTFSASTGAIGGTPSAAQSVTSHTVTVTDGQGFTATTTVSVTVKATLAFTTGYTAISGPTNVAITAQTPSVANGYAPLVYSISPALPTGLSLSSSTGAISGTPTATQAATTHTVTVTDNQSFTATSTVSVTVFTVPGAPTAVTGTRGDGSLTVSWTAPSSNGGSAITGYTAVITGDASKNCTTAGTQCLISGLVNTTAYSFTVLATNAAGDGPTGSGSVTAATAPGTPVVTATPGDTTVALSWSAPSNGGLAISDYQVQYRVTGDLTWIDFVDAVSATTGATVTGLTNGVSYDFHVRAVNPVGQGSYSTTVAASPVATPSGGGGGGGGGSSSGGDTPTTSPTPAASPSPAPTSDPTPSTPPTTLAPGEGVIVINGVETPVTVTVSGDGSSLVVSGGGVTIVLDATGPGGLPLPLAPDGSLVLAQSGTAQVAGSGFDPGSTVLLYMFSDPTYLGSVEVDSSGRMIGSVPVPATIPTGTHVIQAVGKTPTGAPLTLSMAVTVKTPAAARGAHPTVSVAKANQRPAGVRFTVSASGVQARCPVTFWVKGSTATAKAGVAGRAAAVLTAPAAPGRWTVTAKVSGARCDRVTASTKIRVVK